MTATSESLSLSLAAGLLACALGDRLASALQIPSFSLGLVAVLASSFASLAVMLTKQVNPENAHASPFAGKSPF